MKPAILELLASRICHDLISPIGAVHNGVEFLEEMGADAVEDAVGLIAHSAKQASVKLQAFRLAYGAGGRDPNIKPKDIKQTFEELIETDGKYTQDWDAFGLFEEEVPFGFCKILMGTLMIAQESLPKGGVIKVKRDGDQVIIEAEGENAMRRPGVEQAIDLSINIDDIAPRLVHPYAVSMLAKDYGFTITLGESGDNMVSYAIQLS